MTPFEVKVTLIGVTVLRVVLCIHLYTGISYNKIRNN